MDFVRKYLSCDMKRTPLKRYTPLRQYTTLKSHGIKRCSSKRLRQLELESQLTEKIFIKQGCKCADCKATEPDWRGWVKHEVVFRSSCGSPLEEENCVVLCGRCHSKRHGIIEKESNNAYKT